MPCDEGRLVAMSLNQTSTCELGRHGIGQLGWVVTGHSQKQVTVSEAVVVMMEG